MYLYSHRNFPLLLLLLLIVNPCKDQLNIIFSLPLTIIPRSTVQSANWIWIWTANCTAKYENYATTRRKQQQQQQLWHLVTAKLQSLNWPNYLINKAIIWFSKQNVCVCVEVQLDMQTATLHLKQKHIHILCHQIDFLDRITSFLHAFFPHKQSKVWANIHSFIRFIALIDLSASHACCFAVAFATAAAMAAKQWLSSGLLANEIIKLLND